MAARVHIGTAVQRSSPKPKRPVPVEPDLGPGGALVGGTYVVIEAVTGQLAISALLGEEGARLTGGFGAWEVIERPRDVGLTQWTGRPPFEMDLALLLDGYADDRSVENECTTLERLALPTAHDETPPQLRVFGAVPRAGRHWCVQTLDWGDAIRRVDDGHRLRQAVGLHLVEYVSPDRLLRPTKGKAKPKQTVPYLVKRGDTLKTIAKKRLHKATRWKEIAKLNGMRTPTDPKLKPGKRIRIPAH